MSSAYAALLSRLPSTSKVLGGKYEELIKKRKREELGIDQFR